MHVPGGESEETMNTRHTASHPWNADTAGYPIQVERREAPRTPTNELSEMVIDIGGETRTCLVHNISETGAMIETSMQNLPRRFVLMRPSPQKPKLCRIVWQSTSFAGVEFL